MVLPLELDNFTIPDSIDYLTWLVQGVSTLQKHSHMPKTVSHDSDLLVITRAGLTWVRNNQNYI